MPASDRGHKADSMLGRCHVCLAAAQCLATSSPRVHAMSVAPVPHPHPRPNIHWSDITGHRTHAAAPMHASDDGRTLVPARPCAVPSFCVGRSKAEEVARARQGAGEQIAGRTSGPLELPGRPLSIEFAVSVVTTLGGKRPRV